MLLSRANCFSLDPILMEGLTGNSKRCLWYNRDIVINGGEDKTIRFVQEIFLFETCFYIVRQASLYILVYR